MITAAEMDMTNMTPAARNLLGQLSPLLSGKLLGSDPIFLLIDNSQADPMTMRPSTMFSENWRALQKVPGKLIRRSWTCTV